MAHVGLHVHVEGVAGDLLYAFRAGGGRRIRTKKEALFVDE